MGIEISTVALYASLAASLAGAGISAYSSYQSGKAQEQAAARNAQIARDAADNEAQAASENAKRQREENRRRLANIRARQAAGGVQIGSGSALDVAAEAAGELELQTLDAFRESDARQRQMMGQAGMSLWEGSQAATAGQTAAIGTLLSGAGNTADQFSNYRRTGLI